jgi:hypothetical protein
MVPFVVDGVVLILLTTLCLLYLCKRAADDAVRTLSVRGYDRGRSMRSAGIGTMKIGEAPEAECAVCGRWPPALRPIMRSAIESLPLRKPLCRACAAAFARNCWGWVEPPKPEPKPKD